MSGTLLLRADADSTIGAGHVSRCLALAQAWRDLGGSVVLGGAVSQTWLREALLDEGVDLVTGHAERGSKGDRDHLLAMAADLRADWIGIDGYDFGPDFVRDVARRHPTLTVDDSTAPRSVPAGYVVNPNPFGSRAFYEPHGPTTILAGAEFAMLRRPFAYLRHPWSDPEVLTIAFGGGNSSTKSLAVALRESLSNLLSDWFSFVQLLDSQSTPIQQMQLSKAAIAAAGVTALEFCRLGVPQILVSKAPNQRAMATSLAGAGCGLDGGDIGSLNPGVVASLVRALMDDPVRWQKASRELIDGQGAARVALAMGMGRIRLQPVRSVDAGQLLEWANEPSVRAASFDSSQIDTPAHDAWLQAQLEDTDTLFLIAVDLADSPVGQIRFSPTGKGGHEVHLSVDPRRRRQGIGTEMIRAGCRIAYKVLRPKSVIARVRPDNAASLTAFTKAGFSLNGAAEGFVEFSLHGPGLA